MEHPFERYVAPARRRPALWRLGLGVALVVVASIAYVIVLDQLAWQALGGEAYFLWSRRVETGEHPVSVLALLAMFGGLFLGTLLASRLLHGRGPGALLGPAGRTARDFGIAVAAVMAVYAASGVIWALAYDSEPGLEPARWALYALPALALLAVQTGAEEVAFRGYLQGQLAARFRSPVAWAVMPSLAFGAIHYDPALPPANAAIFCAGAAVFGLAAADLTARTGSIGAAWGLHFANNVAALLVLSPPGEFSALALRLTPYAASDPVPLLEVLLVNAALLAAWAAIARAVGRG